MEERILIRWVVEISLENGQILKSEKLTHRAALKKLKELRELDYDALIREIADIDKQKKRG